MRTLARVVERVSLAVHAEIGRHPRPPWKRVVLDAWAPVAETLHASYDHDELRLIVKRGSIEIRVFIVLEPGELVTCLQIPLSAPAVASLDQVEAALRLSDVGATASIEAGMLLVRRAGLVASAPYVERLVDVAQAIALDVVCSSGPYR
jgi:hypothetical protein